MKLVKGSVMSDASAEVEVLLAAAVTDVPHLPHHAETPIDAHHLHSAGVLEMTMITAEVMPAEITHLSVAVVVDV